MRRRRKESSTPIDEIPSSLRRFTGSTPGGWSLEYRAWLNERRAWLLEDGLTPLDLFRFGLAARDAGR